MKKMKYIIIICICIIIIISCVLVVMLMQSKQIEENQSENTITNNNTAKVTDGAEEVKDYTMYYSVQNCVNKYLMYCGISIKQGSKDLDDDAIGSIYGEIDFSSLLGITTEEEKRNAIYNMLSEEYIKANNINIEDTNKYVMNVAASAQFNPKKMRVIQSGNISKYSTYGDIVDKNKEKIQDAYFIVSIDNTQRSFLIELVDASKIKSINDIILKNDVESIEAKGSNVFAYPNIDETVMAGKYFQDYKDTALSNFSESYEKLDKEYREARFGSIEAYEAYIEENRTKIARAIFSKYQVTRNDEYTQYVIADQNNNYYIFRETAVMQYTTILDTYTIDLPEFIERYNNSNEQQKVSLCINRVIQAINAKDYAYAYNKLSEGFKQNYFKTQESFEQYIKNNFFENNTISFDSFSNQASLYTCKATLTDKSSNKTTKQNFIIKLGQDAKFEMSFEVQN